MVITASILDPFQETLDLTQLKADEGFMLKLTAGTNRYSVDGIGDINGDKIDDIIIGENYFSNGRAHIIYGHRKEIYSFITLNSLSSHQGFQIDGDVCITKVGCAGDINGDNIPDIILNTEQSPGIAYVIYGSTRKERSNIQLSSLSRSDGYRIMQGDSVIYEPTRIVASMAGDYNGDGIDVIAISVQYPVTKQKVIVMMGMMGERDDFNFGYTTTADYLVIHGNGMQSLLGMSAGVGDVNGDEINDLLLGAPGILESFTFRFSQSHVIYGKKTGHHNVIELETLSTNDGIYIIEKEKYGNGLGISIDGAGDINNDGINDIVIGTQYDSRTHIVFGRQEATELVIPNMSSVILSGGNMVDSVGDINGDLIDDLIIGNKAGDGYVFFGKRLLSSEYILSNMNRNDGFRIDSGSIRERSDQPVASAGDFNGDAIKDLVLVGGDAAIYVVFGRCRNACRNCPAGAYRPQMAVTGCLSCPEGTYSDETSVSCSECMGGEYSSEGSDRCMTCPKNTYSTAGSGKCIPCEPSYHSDSGSTKCESNHANDAGGTPLGLIIGVVIGTLIVIMIIMGVVAGLVYRRYRRTSDEPAALYIKVNDTLSS